MNWGGSGIEKVVFDWILENVPTGSTVIELGAGHVSTQAFAEHYKTYSVEDNPEYLGHYKVNYIYAHIVNGWYDREILQKLLPPKEEQKLILIDGSNRHNVLFNLDLFNPNAIYLIHDTYRGSMVTLAENIGKKLGRITIFHENGDYWATI